MSHDRALRATTLDIVALTKPRIMVMQLLTAAGAMALAPVAMPLSRALIVLAGMTLIAGAANTLNMWLERDVDCLMSRTKQRPLPAHRLAPNAALVAGTIEGALALPMLALAGIVPAGLGLVALLLYVGVYTPMKQITHHSTWIGAVPGAMSALIGWTGATGHIDLGGLSVFAVLFFWQIPHTYAIAIYRRREYEAAGMKTLPSTKGIRATRIAIALYLVVQVAASFGPYVLGIAGLPYAIVAGVLGALVLVQGLSGDGSAKWAREVFLASIVYMPILFAVMVVAGRA